MVSNSDYIDPDGWKLIRFWDRNWEPQGQLFARWDDDTFTVPAGDPINTKLWAKLDNRGAHQITVESTEEFAWWVDRMYRRGDGSTKVCCRPHLDILRESAIPDWKLVGMWLAAEARWEDDCRRWLKAEKLWKKQTGQWPWSIVIGDGPPIPMSEFTLGDRVGPGCPCTACNRRTPADDPAARALALLRRMQADIEKLLADDPDPDPSRMIRWLAANRLNTPENMPDDYA